MPDEHQRAQDIASPQRRDSAFVIERWLNYVNYWLRRYRFRECLSPGVSWRAGFRYPRDISVAARVVIEPGAFLNAWTTQSGGGIYLGEGSRIASHAMLLAYGGMIRLGKRCSINPFSILYGPGGLEIGDDVLIAAHCVLIPAEHNFSDPARTIKAQGVQSEGIVIGNDVWLGAGVRVLDGVVIGSGTVVGAGSVVTHSLPPNSIAYGVPARVVGQRQLENTR